MISPELLDRARDAVRAGVAFLAEKQGADGSWTDFRIAVGASTEWVTGYIGTAMCRVSKLGLADGRSASLSDRAATFISNAEHDGGGWGFNARAGIDADSTANCLRLLTVTDRLNEDRASRLSALLRSHQNEDGGFGTFCLAGIQAEVRRGNPYFRAIADPARLATHFRGWCSSDPQISAIAFRALSAEDKRDVSIEDRIAQFLAACQNHDGSWNAYWSNGALLGTAHVLIAFSDCARLGDAIQCARSWLLREQRPDGSWTDGRRPRPTPYDTALALTALLAVDRDARSEPAVASTTCLVREQQPDGSWRSFPHMKVPLPWDHSQLQTPTVQPEVEDAGRLFTSATATQALAEWIGRAEEVTRDSGASARGGVTHARR
ncbi:MAG TPA: prenyltransferase/squalene oxidase repeat-containing protein [Gemmatimonadaceae bacterium]